MRTSTPSQSGMSLMEITVTLAVTSALMLVVYALLEDAMKATMFGESHNDLTVITQRVVNELQGEIMQSRVAYQEDAVGTAYRAALQVPASFAKWPNSMMPVFQAETTLDQDAGAGTDRRAGNTLLIARQLPPRLKYDADGNPKTPDVEVPVMYNHDGDPSTPKIELPIDHYRFEYYFLVKSTADNFAGTGYFVDLVRFRSVEYADYLQLKSLSSSQLQEVVPQLQAAGMTRAWSIGQPVGNAFYDLATAAGGVFGGPISSPKIAAASTRTVIPEIRGGRISGAMDYSIAFVPDSPAKPYPIKNELYFYAQPDTSLPKFPSGFEVKVAGPSGNRKVGVRLVLMARYQAGTFESQQALLTASANF